MEHKVEKVSSNQMKIEVTLSVEEYAEYLKKSYEKNKEYFQVPGFRKGHVPYAIVKQKYGIEALYEDADNLALNETYFKIIEDENIKAIAMPEIDIVSQGEKEGMKYTATVEILPDFKLPEIDGLEVAKHNHEFSEADVDRELEAMREKNARLISREDGEASQKGDLVNLDFAGSIDGEAFEGGTAEGYDLELGSGSFIGNFEEQLEGLKVGDEKDVVVTFPENYGMDHLNGKEATFKVKINDIKKKEIPELNDEFASEVSEFETVDDLRGDLSKKMREGYDRHMEEAAKEGALSAVVEKTELEVPNALVERQLDNMLQELEQRLSYQGMDLKTYFQVTNSDEGATREQMRENAQKRAKTDIVVDKLIAESSIEATEEELTNLANDYAKQYGMDEKFAETLLSSNKEGLVHDVKLQKVLKDLVSRVKFVEGEDHHDHAAHE